MFYEPFDVGEVVEVAGVSGKVDSMNIVSTTIKTFDNQVLVIPNNSVWNDVIRNKTKSHERRVDLVFGIGYESKIDEAMSILKEVVGSHDKILETPEPTIKVNELADSSVNLICRPWVKTPDYWDVHWDLMQTVKQRFDEAGISIPYPQTDVHFHWDKNLNPMNKLEADNSETDKKRSENQSSEKQKPKEPINDELDGDQNDDGDNQG
jgi:small conductance mechanosensitive channel